MLLLLDSELEDELDWLVPLLDDDSVEVLDSEDVLKLLALDVLLELRLLVDDCELLLLLDTDDTDEVDDEESEELDDDDRLDVLDSSSRAMMQKPWLELGKLMLPPVVKFSTAGLPAIPAVYLVRIAWRLRPSGSDKVISVSDLLGVSL